MISKKEAANIIDIMMTADNECSTCAKSLINEFVNDYPKFINLAKSAYYTRFKEAFEISDYSEREEQRKTREWIEQDEEAEKNR